MHPFIADRVAGELAHVIDAKRALSACGCLRSTAGVAHVALPPRARGGRHRRARDLESHGQERSSRVDAVGERRCIHWEHGAAWDAGREAERRDYLERVPLAIANSTAAARVLQLLWDYRGDVRVCRNALRPSADTGGADAQAIPARAAIKLGAAARLYPGERSCDRAPCCRGAARAAPSLDVELARRGRGPGARAPRSLAASLGSRRQVTFHGAVSDMPAFYSGIDCLLHTPITEAFGLVAIEAAAHGCPVVAARVDGLAEAVADGVTGRTVAPTLALTRYVELGGALEGCRSASTIPPPTRCASRAPSIPSSWPRRSPPLFEDARATRRGARARARTCSRSRISPPTFATSWQSSMASSAALTGRARRRRMTVVLYRPSLDARSGAGQLLEMQWRGLTSAGVPTVLACERGALKFWLRTGVRARRRSVAEVERLHAEGAVVVDHGLSIAERRARVRAQSRDGSGAARAARRLGAARAARARVLWRACVPPRSSPTRSSSPKRCTSTSAWRASA